MRPKLSARARRMLDDVAAGRIVALESLPPDEQEAVVREALRRAEAALARADQMIAGMRGQLQEAEANRARFAGAVQQLRQALEELARRRTG